MRLKHLLTVLAWGTASLWTYGQTAVITGVILDQNNLPLKGVNITSLSQGTVSDINGFYILEIIADTKTTIRFSHVGYKDVRIENLILTTHETYEFNPVLQTDVVQIDEVVVSPSGERSLKGITHIEPQIIRKIPGANAGVENILKLLPGVTSNNELSTQYAVRGGNYDENLVYVNEIEIYRPFLIRSGQQEGLSFVNSNLVKSLKFSSGGFQAKYGDKLSSVLDITYSEPVRFGLQASASILGANTTVETASKTGKLTTISGVRFRDNSLLVNSQQTQTNFNPTFADLQSYISYRFSGKFRLNFLGTISLNDYQNEPLTRQTNFGTIDNPRALVVAYEGQEKNTYTTALGALKATYHVNDKLSLKLITSLYHTTEVESSDIVAQYELGSVDTNLGGDNLGTITASRGIGSQFNRARNTLDALLFTASHKGNFRHKKSALAWGLKFTHEDIRDQIRESEFIDSAGFSIRPPFPDFINNEPIEPFTAPLVPFEGITATNFVKTSRFSSFVQYSKQVNWKKSTLYYNVGLRAQYWTVSANGETSAQQTIFSPRAQLAIKPDWNSDIVFRIASGLYQQPPFYRELRGIDGIARTDVKAQKSVHFVGSSDYSFTMWDRAFTLASEVYYKKLNQVNPYTIEDVRIRYLAQNNAKAFAYGAELRLNGAFVPGTESWLSIGYLTTQENIDNRGYIARPTDQRFKLGLLFQDYVPTIPNLKMYLNLVYNSGVPGGSPSYADPYLFQSRLRDYKRADLGISHIFVDENQKYPKNHWLHGFNELSVGVEIFNLFNNQNSITNTWVFDVDSKQQIAIPNFMTSRVLNLRLNVRF